MVKNENPDWKTKTEPPKPEPKWPGGGETFTPPSQPVPDK